VYVSVCVCVCVCVCDGYFWDRVSRTIWLGWLWTTVLLLSASSVARIIGVNYQLRPAYFNISLCVLMEMMGNGWGGHLNSSLASPWEPFIHSCFDSLIQHINDYVPGMVLNDINILRVKQTLLHTSHDVRIRKHVRLN
jgi:hypothetical protein